AQSIAHRPDAPLGLERETALSQMVSEQQTKVQQEIQRWAVVGPFDNRGRDGLNREYPPETEFRFDKSYVGKNGSVAWKPATVWSGDKYYVDLGTRFDDWTVHYAYSRVYSPQET